MTSRLHTYIYVCYNVCPAEKRTKHSTNILMRLVRFSAGQTLCSLWIAPVNVTHLRWI